MLMTEEISENDVRSFLRPIKEDASKITRGRLFMVCGSYGMAGALILSARAALRSGAGYLDLAVPERLYPIVTASVPEAVCSVYDEKDPETAETVILTGIEKADAVLVGCGLGKLRELLCPIVLSSCKKPLLIDADALNYLSLHPEQVIRAEDHVMTPHEGEMARLLQVEAADIHEKREESVLNALQRFSGTMVLKGPGTLVASDGMLKRNPTGNAGMARAGSGDVLSGMTASFMAQGLKGFEAACTGVFLHGKAGDLASERFGKRSMTPFDMTACIPDVLKAYPA